MSSDAVVLGTSLVALVMGYFGFRWSLAIYPLAEGRAGLLGALGRSYEHTGHAQLQYFVFLLASTTIWAIPSVSVTLVLPELFAAPVRAFLMPLVSLATANVVVAFDPQRS